MATGHKKVPNIFSSLWCPFDLHQHMELVDYFNMDIFVMYCMRLLGGWGETLCNGMGVVCESEVLRCMCFFM